VSALVVLLAQGLAFWPVAHWIAVRLRYDTEDRWEVVALGVAGLFVLDGLRRAARAGRSHVSARALVPPCLLLGIYAASYTQLPEMLRAVLAISIVVITAAQLVLGLRSLCALWGLSLLGLPVVPMLQFQLGYPLRVLTAEIAAPILRCGGVDVLPMGTCLEWAGRLVWVDAPCGGVRMLWSGLFVACALACGLRLGNARSLLLVGLAGVGLVGANALRAAALFLLENGLVTLPAADHECVGLLVHALLLVGIARLASRLRPAPPPLPPTPEEAACAAASST